MATLQFDSVQADLDTHALLAASTQGAMQLATEVQLVLLGQEEPLRVWRYGALAQQPIAHGK